MLDEFPLYYDETFMQKAHKFLSVFVFTFIFLLSATQSVKAVEYEGTNTGLADDDVSTQIPINFNFSFFGNTYSNVCVTSNGLLIFDSCGSSSDEYDNLDLPSATDPDNTIAAFWDDLTTNIIGGDYKPSIYYTTVGSAPNRKFIVQWTNMYFFGTDIQMGSFQAILYETTNVIRIQYPQLLGGSRALGNSASIGLENANGSAARKYSFNSQSLTQGQAITFTPSGGNFTMDSEASIDDVWLVDSSNPAPDTPTLTAPNNSATGVNVRPEFSWNAADNATSYRLLVSSQSNFSSLVVNQSGITGTSYTLNSNLSDTTTYYWRVEAINDYGSSLSSSRTFTTGVSNASPNAPSSLGPAQRVNGSGTSSNTPGFNFTITDPNGSDTVRFRIQVDDTANFSSPVLDYTSGYGSQGSKVYVLGVGTVDGSYTVGSDETTLADGNYYWRVLATDNHGASSSYTTANSGQVAFIVNTGTPTISNLDVDVSSTSATLTWDTAQAASTQVGYGLLPSFGLETTQTDTNPRVTSHTVTLNNLQPCARYFFTAHSRNNANTLDDEEGTFTTLGCTDGAVGDGEQENISKDNGGTVTFENGQSTITLEVPEDFSDESAYFQINKIDNANVTPPGEMQSLIADNIFNLVAITESDETLTNFDEPLTFIVEYPESIESLFVEESLDVYHLNENTQTWEALSCTQNTTENTLTCTLTHFSTYGVFGMAIGLPGPSTVIASAPAAAHPESCSETKPSGTPELFQVDVKNSQATLHFTPVSSNVNHYYVRYGTGTNTEEFGVQFDKLSDNGVQSFTISDLQPNTQYTFVVRGGHGCMPGDWSNQMSVTTNTSAQTTLRSFYKNQPAQQVRSQQRVAVEPPTETIASPEPVMEVLPSPVPSTTPTASAAPQEQPQKSWWQKLLRL